MPFEDIVVRDVDFQPHTRGGATSYFVRLGRSDCLKVLYHAIYTKPSNVPT